MNRQIVDQLTEYLVSAEGTDKELVAAFERRFPLATDEDFLAAAARAQRLVEARMARQRRDMAIMEKALVKTRFDPDYAFSDEEQDAVARVRRDMTWPTH